MASATTWRRAGAGLATALLLALAVPDSYASAGWREDLVIEIRSAHDCEVAYITHIVERNVEGRQVIFAKVHCMDQRSFDATRTDEKEFFSFSECTREESEAC